MLTTRYTTRNIKKGVNFRTLDFYGLFKCNFRILKPDILIFNNLSMVTYINIFGMVIVLSF